MQVHHYSEHLPQFHNAVITIGTFDGVHLGHQQIIRQIRSVAKQFEGESVIITFHPHPRKVVHGEKLAIELLNSLEERIQLLDGQGVDHLVIVPFTQSFSQMEAREYVREFLFSRFQPKCIIIGFDHRFGKNKTGDYHLLTMIGSELGFEVLEIPAHIQQAASVSSTRIRQMLKDGHLEEANKHLGYAYGLTGKVITGDQKGRTIGYPTANLEITDQEKLIPSEGVYAVELEISGIPGNYKGMMNIGYRPTVGGQKRSIEVNIFDFNTEIYGRTIQLHLHYYLRKEIKFNSLEQLKAQLEKDKRKTIALLQG